MTPMKRKVIAVDIDDVLGNSTEALRLEVNRQLGVNLLPEHYLVPDDYTGYYQRVWQRHGLAERMSLEQLEPFMQTNQSHVPANDKAFQTLKKLSQSYEFIVITSRPSSWRPATQQWLSDNFPGLFDKLLFTEEGERKTKGQLCVEHSAACLIDDNVEHA